MFSHILKDNKHLITWKSTPIPLQIYNQTIKYSETNPTFAPSSPKQEELISQQIKHDPKQTLAIIRLSNLARIVKHSYRLEKPQIIADIINSDDALAMSAKYDIPPLNVLYIIFRRHYGENLANRLFKSGEYSVLKQASKHHRAQYYLAERNDSSGLLMQRLTSIRSKESEDYFISLLRRLGITLKTEDDLKAEGSQITPDVLFTDEVYINDQKITWIDFKDYAGTPIPFIWSKNKKQTKKYYDKWGYGALCFSQSYVEGLQDDSAMILDESPLRVYILDNNKGELVIS